LQTSAISAGNISMTDLKASAPVVAREKMAPVIRIGDVFGRSRKIFAANWIFCSSVGIVGYAPGLALTAWTSWIASRGVASGFGADIFTALVYSVCWVLAQSVIQFRVFHAVSDRRFSVGQSISATLRQAAALLTLCFLILAYAMLAGFYFLAPAFVVICEYAVASPACVIEGIGPLKSMSRSSSLTKGNDSRILRLLTVLFLGHCLGVLVGYLAQLASGPILSLAICLPLRGITIAFSSVTIAVLYARLRAAREGVDIEHVAEVFD
jgi:hypothetical protein